jgi:predicted TIM-barrel enzyme
LPLLVGSGCTEHNVAEILSIVDGVIVASSLKVGGVWWNPVDETKVRAFMAAAR